jgi:hypothetical protein
VIRTVQRQGTFIHMMYVITFWASLHEVSRTFGELPSPWSFHMHLQVKWSVVSKCDLRFWNITVRCLEYRTATPKTRFCCLKIVSLLLCRSIFLRTNGDNYSDNELELHTAKE